jgi:hypothetical protein
MMEYRSASSAVPPMAWPVSGLMYLSRPVVRLSTSRQLVYSRLYTPELASCDSSSIVDSVILTLTSYAVKSCHHHRASTLSVTSTGRLEQLEDGPRRRRNGCPRDSHESAVGLLELLADVGKSEPSPCGLNYYASTGGGQKRQSDARDSALLVFSRRGTGRATSIIWQGNRASFLFS